MKQSIYRVVMLVIGMMPQLCAMEAVELTRFMEPDDEQVGSACFLKSRDKHDKPLIAMLSAKGRLYAGSYNESALQSFWTPILLGAKAIAMKRTKEDTVALVAETAEQESTENKSLFLVDIKKLLNQGTDESSVKKLRDNIRYPDSDAVTYKRGILVADFMRNNEEVKKIFWDLRQLDGNDIPECFFLTVKMVNVLSEIAVVVDSKRELQCFYVIQWHSKAPSLEVAAGKKAVELLYDAPNKELIHRPIAWMANNALQCIDPVNNTWLQNININKGSNIIALNYSLKLVKNYMIGKTNDDHQVLKFFDGATGKSVVGLKFMYGYNRAVLDIAKTGQVIIGIETQESTKYIFPTIHIVLDIAKHEQQKAITKKMNSENLVTALQHRALGQRLKHPAHQRKVKKAQQRAGVRSIIDEIIEQAVHAV